MTQDAQHTPGLTRYAECDYSLFISYAHKDDSAEDDWVTALKDALWKRLGKLNSDTILGLHLSGENGPSAGHLTHRLEERVRKSFGMLLVVGDKYVKSGWCEKELELFRNVFGPEGTKTRLFIVAMSQKALRDAQQGERWKEIVSQDQLWVPMFREDDPKTPLQHKLNDGTLTPLFFDRIKRIATPLIEQIEKDLAKPIEQIEKDLAKPVEQIEKDLAKPIQQIEKDSTKPIQRTAKDLTKPVEQIEKDLAEPEERSERSITGVRHMPDTTSLVSAAPKLRVAIGPYVDSMSDKAKQLKGALESAGAAVTLLDRALLHEYDPDDGSLLRPELEKADVLVVPLTQGKPLKPDTDGGHAIILASEWARLTKSRDAIWYWPADMDIKPDTTTAPRHREQLDRLAPVCTSEQAVVGMIFGARARDAIKVFIEEHPRVPEYYRLADKLHQAWTALPNAPNRPQLRCKPLNLSKLESFKGEAPEGVVLLLPQGLKTPDSLEAQQFQVEERFPSTSSVYPGCVALIFKGSQNGAWGMNWTLLEIVEPPDGEAPLVVDVDSEENLEAFLRYLLLRHRRVSALAGT
jgi:hypothetical protein